MTNPRKLKVNFGTLMSVLGGCDLENVSAYLDTETGEVLSATDMFPEELQNRKRFLKIPSKKIWVIGREAAENWLEDRLSVFAQSYDEISIDKAKSQLEQALERDDSSKSIQHTILELDREMYDDHFFDSWMEFVQNQEKSNITSWLASKGIILAK